MWQSRHVELDAVELANSRVVPVAAVSRDEERAVVGAPKATLVA